MKINKRLVIILIMLIVIMCGCEEEKKLPSQSITNFEYEYAKIDLETNQITRSGKKQENLKLGLYFSKESDREFRDSRNYLTFDNNAFIVNFEIKEAKGMYYKWIPTVYNGAYNSNQSVCTLITSDDYKTKQSHDGEYILSSIKGNTTGEAMGSIYIFENIASCNKFVSVDSLSTIEKRYKDSKDEYFQGFDYVIMEVTKKVSTTGYVKNVAPVVEKEIDAEIVAYDDKYNRLENISTVTAGTKLNYSAVIRKDSDISIYGDGVKLDEKTCSETTTTNLLKGIGYNVNEYKVYNCASYVVPDVPSEMTIRYYGGSVKTKTIPYEKKEISNQDEIPEQTDSDIDAKMIALQVNPYDVNSLTVVNDGDTVDNGSILSYYVVVKDQKSISDIRVMLNKTDEILDCSIDTGNPSLLDYTSYSASNYMRYLCDIDVLATTDAKTATITYSSDTTTRTSNVNNHIIPTTSDYKSISKMSLEKTASKNKMKTVKHQVKIKEGTIDAKLVVTDGNYSPYSSGSSVTSGTYLYYSVLVKNNSKINISTLTLDGVSCKDNVDTNPNFFAKLPYDMQKYTRYYCSPSKEITKKTTRELYITYKQNGSSNYFKQSHTINVTKNESIISTPSTSSKCPSYMVSGVKANDIDHCAISNYKDTEGMEVQGKYKPKNGYADDQCCITYAFAYWNKLMGITPNKYYNNGGSKNCPYQKPSTLKYYGADTEAITNAFKFFVNNNKPGIGKVKNGSTDQHWITFVGVTEEAYSRYITNPNGFKATISDLLIREVYDGELYNGSTSFYGEQYKLYSYGIYY